MLVKGNAKITLAATVTTNVIKRLGPLRENAL